MVRKLNMSVSRLDNKPMEGGIVPDMQFKYTYKYFSCPNLPISEGIDPLIELEVRYSVSRKESDPIDEGIVPMAP
jgi:hypothetical protein